jgi:hypothetical protein
MSTPLDEALQIFATPRVIFYKQNFHLKGEATLRASRASAQCQRATPLKAEYVFLFFWSRMVATGLHFPGEFAVLVRFP